MNDSRDSRWIENGNDKSRDESRDGYRKRECVHYFREHSVFDRLLKGFREKYLSYGSFSGTVLLRNLKENEREDLEGFLRRNYHGKKSASVSAEHFRKALSDSRFSEITPDELLRLYFQEELTGKKEQKRSERQAREAVFEQLKNKYAGTPAGEWIRAVSGGYGNATSLRSEAECARDAEKRFAFCGCSENEEKTNSDFQDECSDCECSDFTPALMEEARDEARQNDSSMKESALKKNGDSKNRC